MVGPVFFQGGRGERCLEHGAEVGHAGGRQLAGSRSRHDEHVVRLEVRVKKPKWRVEVADGCHNIPQNLPQEICAAVTRERQEVTQVFAPWLKDEHEPFPHHDQVPKLGYRGDAGAALQGVHLGHHSRLDFGSLPLHAVYRLAHHLNAIAIATDHCAEGADAQLLSRGVWWGR